MKKTGNNHSDLLNKIAEITNAEPQKLDAPVQIQEMLKQPKEPTLKELFAQFGQEMADPTMGDIPGPPGGDIPPEETVADTEEAKRALCEALQALCGSLEEAHGCLDQYCGEEGLGEEGLGGLGGPPEMGAGEPAPMSMPGLM